MGNPKILTARDIMTSPGVVVHPEMSIFRAIPILVRKNITGCPVVDSKSRLLGMLSELDCMKVIASDAFHADDHSTDLLVEQYMTTDCLTVGPEIGIFRIANIFFEHTLRRIPVVEGERLIGQLTRSDVLRAIHQMRISSRRAKRYPDFAWPSTMLQ